MKNVRVIIGSAFGDEGKGITTDYLSKNWADLVVRFNGGAQAGHTVKHKNIEHVFGHFGSGTLNDIATYLSEYFVVNPMLFVKEMNELHDKNIQPRVYVNENCIVTTIFDMFVNQMIESWRSRDRHGSCGIGFNEAITRHLDTQFKLRVIDLVNDVKGCMSTIDAIWEQYVLNRCVFLGIPENIVREKMNEVSFDVMKMQMHSCIGIFLENVKVVKDTILHKADNVVFEGAQGLLLDEFHEWFPHVTRSRTGIKNVNKILNGHPVETVQINYITRAYTTRHGAGPFPREADLPYSIVDSTNVPNEHQGILRFGYLDLELLERSISNDLLNYDQDTITQVQLVVTCLDQISDIVFCYDEGGSMKEIPVDEFGQFMEDRFNMPILLNDSAITPDQMSLICNNAPEIPSIQRIERLILP
jgi:adenylosuccinate synthase